MPDLQPDKIRAVWKLPFEGAWPSAVAFLGTHRRVASGNQNGTLLVWDLPESPVATKFKDEQGKELDGFETPAPVRKLEGHENSIQRLAATADGQTLVSVSLDRSVRLWDLRAPAAGTTSLVIDEATRQRQAKRVEASKRDAILNAPGITVETQQAAAVFNGHKEWINALDLSRDGRRCVTGDDAGTVIVWDVAERREVTRWQCPGVAWVVALAFSPDAQTVLVSQYRRKGGDFNNYPAGLRLYDAATGAIKLDILATLYPKEKNPKYQYQYEYSKFVAAGLVATAFSPDGKLLACGQGGEDGEGKIHVLETETGKAVRQVGGHQYGVTDLAFSRDGKWIFSTGRDTTLRITNVDDGKEVAKLGKPRGGQFTDWLSALSVSPDERFFAASDISGHVQVWEAQPGEPKS